MTEVTGPPALAAGPAGPAAPAPALELERTLALAYAHLNRRERTVQEMRAHLRKRGVDEEVVEAALDELGAAGYLDDQRFASVFSQDKRELEHWGSQRIRQALLARGIDAEVADAVLDQSSRSGELDRALGLLRRRFAEGLPGRRESERALGMLLRKGYEYELAAQALTEHRRLAPEAAPPAPPLAADCAAP